MNRFDLYNLYNLYNRYFSQLIIKIKKLKLIRIEMLNFFYNVKQTLQKISSMWSTVEIKT